MSGLIIDSVAGGGGASLGIEMALGWDVWGFEADGDGEGGAG